MYVIVRDDLTPTHQLVQAVHAAHEVGIRYGNPDDISSMVVCSIPDEKSLRLLNARASLAGIKTYMFEEDDFDNQATAFATEPISGEARRFFRKLPLWEPALHGEVV